MTIRDFVKKWPVDNLTEDVVVHRAKQLGIDVKTSSKGNLYISGKDAERLEEEVSKWLEKSAPHEPPVDGASGPPERKLAVDRAIEELVVEMQPLQEEEEREPEAVDKPLDNSPGPIPADRPGSGRSVNNSMENASFPGGARKAKGTETILSWAEAAREALAKDAEGVGGIGIVGLRATGKTWFLRAISRCSRLVSSWSMDHIDENWKGKNEIQLQKTSEHEFTVLHGALFSEEHKASLDVQTVEVSGEAWRLAFKTDGYIRENAAPRLWLAISGLRRFIASCEGFLFLVDAGLTVDVEAVDEGYRDGGGEPGSDFESPSVFKNEVVELWRSFVDKIAELDAQHSDKGSRPRVKRPLAIVFTKADIAFKKHASYSENDYFRIKDLCISESIASYMRMRNETKAVRGDKAKTFLADHYDEINTDLAGGGKVEISDVFAVSCLGVSNHAERSVCVEEPVDWVATLIWQKKWCRQEAQKRATTAAERKDLRRRRRTRLKRVAIVLFFLLALALSTIAVAAWRGERMLADLSRSYASGNLDRASKARRTVSHCPLFPFTSQMFQTMADKHETITREGALFFARLARGRLAAGDVQGAWDFLAYANEEWRQVDAAAGDDFLELAMETSLVECRQAVAEASLDGTGELIDDAIRTGGEKLAAMGAEEQELAMFHASLGKTWLQACEARAFQEPEFALRLIKRPPPPLLDHDALPKADYERALGSIKRLNVKRFLEQGDFHAALDALTKLERLASTLLAQRDIAQHLTRIAGRQRMDGATVESILPLFDRVGGYALEPALRNELLVRRLVLHKVRFADCVRNGRLDEAKAELKTMEGFEMFAMAERNRFHELLSTLQTMVFVQGDDDIGCFYMDRLEFALVDFVRFMDADTGDVAPRRREQLMHQWRESDTSSPAFGMTWPEAVAAAKFHGKRLPTAREWQHAFGPTQYSWGNDWRPGSGNTQESRKGMPLPPSHHLVHLDRNAKGIHGLSGNVSEWTLSQNDSGEMRLVAGGNFLFDRTHAGGGMLPRNPDSGYPYVGMRGIMDASLLEHFLRRLQGD